MKNLYTLLTILLFSFCLNAQIIVIDPGHGYGSSTSNNPDGRTATEIETALAVGLKTKTLIQNNCSALTVNMTRTTNINGWTSVTQRAQMSNNWNADRLISIHCNAGGGTGTETFYCTYDDTSTTPDINFSKKIQADMVTNGSFNNRRCVEDNSYLSYHLGVLRYSSATACLNEIGFVDHSTDAAKLNSNTWRDKFALSYFNSLKSNLNITCSASSAPGSFSLTATPECVNNSSRINLTWTSSANATSYDIYRNGSLYASNIAGTSFLNTYVTSGTTYTYYIKAKNASGSINNSNGTLTRTAACTPGSFTLTASATCSGSTSAINLTWTTSANATSYDIYRNGNLYASNVTGNSFLNTYLINAGSVYTYYIKAKNSSGTLNNSNGSRSVTATSCAAKASNENDEQLEFNGEISLYPNPAINEITFEINNVQSKNVTLDIFDISGKRIKNMKLNSDNDLIQQQLNISEFASGIYFINFTIDNKEYLKKFVKQ
ncbi:N-acetylmuramoyl-L-alanine amidase [Flavobacterium sediminilitoris]|uniref:N-acetylmuramoyl-L-alanine amidase n=1 Tax=Flavobacterium sediminilitoris TaxID=2024526 RepID=A0ABY4HJP1_9FLAO|nr:MULTISPECIES: N-acetylmuramoyl-L-alanine amidase [Flavobacterium]UOX33056.1 N-acetylmuramoyl-L-alanine amidase [Flavobacterium sediminilitoris]